MENDHHYMTLALEEARAAAARDEVPIGAVIIDPATGTVIARDGNRTREFSDPTAHAEMLALRAACAHDGAQRIPAYDLYVTLEPCAMCAAAISFARIRRLIIGTTDPKGGGVIHGGRFYEQNTCHHRPLVTQDIESATSAQLLKDFFAEKRNRAL